MVHRSLPEARTLHAVLASGASCQCHADARPRGTARTPAAPILAAPQTGQTPPDAALVYIWCIFAYRARSFHWLTTKAVASMAVSALNTFMLLPVPGQ
jgi:hypothetical protein